MKKEQTFENPFPVCFAAICFTILYIQILPLVCASVNPPWGTHAKLSFMTPLS